MIKVYLVSIGNLNPHDSIYSKLISKERLEKSRRYLKEKDKALSIAAELILNYAIKENYPEIKCPMKFEKNPYGKIFIKEFPEINFNISHSGDYAVCALSEADVGIDIEKIRPISIDIAERFFTEKEYKFIMNKPQAQRLSCFYRLWVLKESYMKARGLGFNLPLKDFCINFDKAITVFEQGGFKDCSFYEFNIDCYKLAVCKLSKTCDKDVTIECVNLKECLNKLLDA